VQGIRQLAVPPGSAFVHPSCKSRRLLGLRSPSPANLIAQFSKVKGPITAKLIFSAQTVWLFQHRIFIVKT
jgi:hypothetical protein